MHELSTVMYPGTLSPVFLGLMIHKLLLVPEGMWNGFVLTKSCNQITVLVVYMVKVTLDPVSFICTSCIQWN